MTTQQTSRRDFLKNVTAVAATAALAPNAFAQNETTAPKKLGIKLGLDNFAVRAMKWKAPQLIDYAAQLKTDSLFITDFAPFEKFDDDYLRDLRKMAADKGLQIQLGSWSICPTSTRFKKEWGTAEEHLALGIRMAQALGSSVFRVVLGSAEDRATPGGIDARIADTVKVLKSQRSKAIDAGVKIAVENHAGDMHSTELLRLIEEGGKDYVGANIDSGNACWTLEDPLQNLENLGANVATSSLRDSAIWEYEDGAKVQWTAMGDGQMDLKAYFKRFAELCPGVPVHIETISGFARSIPYLKQDFWKAWPNMRAVDFARFAALARRGKPFTTVKNPQGATREETEQLGQKAEIERSIKYCQQVLGLGLKG
ncbi:MAG TPA: sugar phosphate isomerase/epimerase [Methylomirabilota bacterium]|nr:sugar phosphate isomerase/epimerase [Methylomirabilota bacterium]